MILIIDNYDSFTYNLYQYIGEMNPEIEVFRNDKITVEEIERKNPSHIIISPGPGYPKDAGVSIQVIKELGSRFPILGVCLGHQAIGEAFGGIVSHAVELMHGKSSMVEVDKSCPIFSTLPDNVEVGRYHSLIVKKEKLPESLKITAKTLDGEIMGLQHINYPVFGIQFHPESILTPTGKEMLRNFLRIEKTDNKK